MAKPDRTRKLIVRSALVTSTTIGTLVGAQNLAMLDASQFQWESTEPATNNIVVVPAIDPSAITPAPVAIVQVAPDIEIRQAAPSITILRQVGQNITLPPIATTIQPPVSQAIIAPQPVVVQQSVQPVSQRSRSSR